jgi:hypothetical protein
MRRKIQTVLLGMFSYKRTPAAEIDGGANEYVYQQFQTLPRQDVVAGRGWIYQRDLLLTQPTVFVVAPVSAPYDVTRVPVGLPDIEAALIEEEMLP